MYYQNKLSCSKPLLVRPWWISLDLQPMGKNRRKNSSHSSVRASHKHLLRSVPDNIVSPLQLPSWGGSVTINEASGQKQLNTPRYSRRQSQWSQHLDAEFEPCLQNVSVPEELESFSMAAASPSPVSHLSPRTHMWTLTAGRSTEPNPKSSLPLSVLSLRPQK